MLHFHIADQHADKNALIEIYDSFGRRVMQQDVSSYGTGWHSYYLVLQNNSAELPAGIYYAKLKVGEQYMNTLIICKL
jgi:hypothetical protein